MTMALRVILLSLVVFLASGAPAEPHAISWGNCTNPAFNTTRVAISCGNLTVPLDYTDPSTSSTLRLELVKVPAVKEPFGGSILFNFGGPGIAGTHDLVALAPLLQLYNHLSDPLSIAQGVTRIPADISMKPAPQEDTMI